MFPDVRWIKVFHSDYFVYVSYFISGYVITHYLKSLRYMKELSIVCCVLSLFVGILNDINGFTSFPIEFFMSISFFTVLLYAPVNESALLFFVSNASYGMYLSHVVFISVFLIFGFANLLPLWIEPLAMAVAVMIAECMVMVVIRKLGLNKWLN